MAQSGVSVDPKCVSAFNELKLGKSIKWIIYKLSDDGREIVVEDSSPDDNYDSFREKLIAAKSKDKSGKEGPGPRFAVYDVQYDAPGGAGKRNKITFIAWSPDSASISPKMIYSSSKEALKRALNGLAVDVQANDEDEIEWDNIVSLVSRGGR